MRLNSTESLTSCVLAAAFCGAMFQRMSSLFVPSKPEAFQGGVGYKVINKNVLSYNTCLLTMVYGTESPVPQLTDCDSTCGWGPLGLSSAPLPTYSSIPSHKHSGQTSPPPPARLLYSAGDTRVVVHIQKQGRGEISERTLPCTVCEREFRYPSGSFLHAARRLAECDIH